MRIAIALLLAAMVAACAMPGPASFEYNSGLSDAEQAAR